MIRERNGIPFFEDDIEPEPAPENKLLTVLGIAVLAFIIVGLAWVVLAIRSGAIIQ